MKVNSKLMGFGAGTKILMADGSQKPIEQVKTGDYVLSFDQLNAFGELEPKRVLNTFSRLDKNPLHVKVDVIDAELVVAEGQLFINPGSDWKDAININEIIDSEGNVRTFDVSRITRGKHFIYDIIVEDNHSLIANGVRVHNMTYTIADVIAGRNLAGTNIQSGPVSNYYRTDDLENSNQYYQEGNSKKRKRGRKKDTRPEPKVDGIQAAAKLLSSLEDLLDGLSEIVADTSPTNLTTIKLVLITSVDNIRNYIGDIGNAILNSTMSAYDKSEILVMSQDMLSASVAMRKPFEEATVSPAGKLVVLNLLKVIDLQMARIDSVLESYTGPADEDRELFDVERDGQRTRGKKDKRYEASRDQRGNYSEGGSRNDYGSDKGRGNRTVGGGPNPAKTTNPGKNPNTKVRAPGREGPPGPAPRASGGNQKLGPGAREPGGSGGNAVSRDNQSGASRTNPNRTSGNPTNSGSSISRDNQSGASRTNPNRTSGNPTNSGSSGVSRDNQSGASRTNPNRTSGNPTNSGTSSGAKSGGGCFAYGTLFKMADGSLKAIQDIRIGDGMLDGGKVDIVLQGNGYNEDWYLYNDILVTGSHPVLDTDGIWRRVENTATAIPADAKDTFYSLYNENQRMIAFNDTVFTDFLEVGMQHPFRKMVYGMRAEELISLLNAEEDVNS
jgi:hypothetical protein